MYPSTELRMIDEVYFQRDLFDIILDQGSQALSYTPSLSTASSPFSDDEFLSITPFRIPQIERREPIDKKMSCTCVKTKCQRGYCPCFKEGEKCGSGCVCIGCKNQEFIPRKVSYIFGSTKQMTLPPFSFSE